MPSNISFAKISLSGFRELASARLGFQISIEDPYKICDFKPAFGLLFEEHLSGYQYWGYCDLDMVFGDIAGFLNRVMSENPDIISNYSGFMSGPLSIYRNTPEINRLFQDCPDYRKIFQNTKHYAFDENIRSKSPRTRRISRIVHFMPFIFWCFRNRVNFKDLKYHFQWYIKYMSLNPEHPEDMTEAVLSASSNRRLKACFCPFLLTDPLFIRIKQKSWEITWHNGKLYEGRRHKEIMAFQFQESKKTGKFVIENPDPAMNVFSITPDGIKNG